MKQQDVKQLGDLDWDAWKGKDPATLVFVIREGEVLLINKKTGLGKGKVNGPGGKVDPGETPEACAVRECQEELGITVSRLEYCGQHRFQFVDGYSIHVWVYRTRDFEGVPTESREAKPLWVPSGQHPLRADVGRRPVLVADGHPRANASRRAGSSMVTRMLDYDIQPDGNSMNRGVSP